MVRCAIMGCRSKTVKEGPIKFFSFPRDENMREEWLRHCRPNITVKHARVCSNHFGPEDYFKSLRHILLNIEPKKVRTLKVDAVPRLQINGVVDELNMRLLTEDDNVGNELNNNGQRLDGVENESATEESDKKKEWIAVEVPADHEYSVRNMPANLLNETSPSKRPKKIKTADVNRKYPIEMVPLNLLAERSLLKIKSPGEIEITDPSGILYPIQIESVKHEKPTIIVQCPQIMENASTTTDHEYITPNSTILKIEPTDFKTATTIDQHYRLPSGDNNSYVFITQEAVQEKSQSDTIKLPLSEYKALKKKADQFEILKTNLEKIFTPGQVKSIMKPDSKKRVIWSADDISGAAALRRISPKGYRYLKNIVGFPLPGISTICKWIANDTEGVIRKQLSEGKSLFLSE